MRNIIEVGAEPLYIAEITKSSELLGKGKIVRTNGRILSEAAEKAVKKLLQIID